MAAFPYAAPVLHTGPTNPERCRYDQADRFQRAPDEPGEPTSIAGRAKGWYRKHKTTINAIGAVAGVAGAVAGAVLTTLAKEQYTPAGIESEEREEREELEEREEREERKEKPTRARCNDGSTTDAAGKQGACSHHGGLAA
nr:hypothetical protein OG781_41955 [Streptomyces sp. NBC_00830]